MPQQWRGRSVSPRSARPSYRFTHLVGPRAQTTTRAVLCNASSRSITSAAVRRHKRQRRLDHVMGFTNVTLHSIIDWPSSVRRAFHQRSARSVTRRAPASAESGELMNVRTGLYILLAVAAAAAAGCGGNTLSGAEPRAPSIDSGSGSSPSPIQHVVLIVQENRTFNDFFATFPGADGTTTGKAEVVKESGCHVSKKTIKLKESNLVIPSDINLSIRLSISRSTAASSTGSTR